MKDKKDKEICLYDKIFIPFIKKEKIQETVKELALRVYEQYKDTTPLFIGVLNGVILFFSDFLKFYPGPCQIAFIQLSSYQGTKSKDINILLHWPVDLKGKEIVILEDIVDTGKTLKKIKEMLEGKQVKSAKIVSLFFKPEVFKEKIKVDFIGLEIPNKFILGYGLDYDGLGRNYEEIYQLKE